MANYMNENVNKKKIHHTNTSEQQENSIRQSSNRTEKKNFCHNLQAALQKLFVQP